MTIIVQKLRQEQTTSVNAPKVCLTKSKYPNVEQEKT